MTYSFSYEDFGELKSAIKRNLEKHSIYVEGPHTISQGRDITEYLSHEKNLDVFSVPKGLGVFLIISKNNSGVSQNA